MTNSKGYKRQWTSGSDIISMTSNNEGFISDQHGSGANVGGDDERIGGGSNAAGSTENSFEYIPPPIYRD